MAGIEAAHAIRAEHPEVGVVVLSQHANAAYALELLKDGSAGYAYLLKDRLGEIGDLLRALREVTRGGSLIDAKVVETLVDRRRRAEQSSLTELTPRELDVLHAMAEGKTNKEIGGTLFLSESSVEKHVAAIFATRPGPRGAGAPSRNRSADLPARAKLARSPVRGRAAVRHSPGSG